MSVTAAETLDGFPPFNSKLSVDEAWARVQAMCVCRKPEPLPVINIDQIGPHFFVVVNQNDVNILKRHYRMIADFFSRDRPDVPFSSARLLPEQVQILVENGFAQLRKISEMRSICTIEQEYPPEKELQEDEEKLQATAMKMVLGRKSFKAQSRKFAKEDIGPPPSKLQKIESSEKLSEEFTGDASGPSASEEEVSFAVQELRQRSREKMAKESSRWRFPLLKLSYELISRPSFPCDSYHLSRLHTFRDLWRKGFYLTAGTKFGCDFLAYIKPPGIEHSRFMVMCVCAGSSVPSIDFIAISRVASQVQKKVLLAIVTPGTQIPYYVKMNWWKGSS